MFTENFSKEDLGCIGIYAISSPSGKTYVGMTADSFNNRWKAHIKNLKGNRHCCAGLQNAFNKHGLDNLTFTIVFKMAKNSGAEKDCYNFLLLKEQEVWDAFKKDGVKLLNARPTGTGSVFQSEDTRKKISESLKANIDGRYLDLIAREDEIIELISDPSLSWYEIYTRLGVGKKRLTNYINYRQLSINGEPIKIFGKKIPQSPQKYKSIKAEPIWSGTAYMKKYDLSRDEFKKKVKEKWEETGSKTITAENFGITIKEVSFICNEGKAYSPGLQRTHERFHANWNKVFEDCQYCLDSGLPVNVTLPSARELHEMFVEKKMSMIAIANKYGINKAKVQQLLYKYGIRR